MTARWTAGVGDPVLAAIATEQAAIAAEVTRADGKYVATTGLDAATAPLVTGSGTTAASLRAAYVPKDGTGRTKAYRVRRPTLPGQMVQAYGGISIQAFTATGSMTMRTGHRIAVAARDIRFVFNFQHMLTNSATATEAPLTGDVPLNATVEINGTTYPLSFNGARVTTLIDSGTLISDPLALDVAAGTEFYVRLFANLTNVMQYPVMLSSLGPSVVLNHNGYTNGSDTTASTGNMVGDQGITQLAGPAAILGDPIAGPTVVLGCVGDSIPSGQGDSTSNWNNSWITRATNAQLPLFRYCAPGLTMSGLRAAHLRGMHMLTNCTHVLVQPGTNDIANGRTSAQVIADLTWMYQALIDRGAQVYGCTLIPRTTSTDSWATTANQTPQAGFEAGGSSKRGQVNAFIRGGGAGLLSGYVELADTVETARDSGLWKVNGTANYLTADGTHPTPAASVLMAAAVNLGTFTLT